MNDEDDFERYRPDVKAVSFDKDHKYEVVKFSENTNNNDISVNVSDIEKRLNEIYDPEIPVSILELGLVYDININEKNEVSILMTLTAPNCPAAEILPEEVVDETLKVDGVSAAGIEITWNPPWELAMMSEEAMLELGFL